jgi:hypothetical protein
MLGKTFKGLTDELLAWQTEQLLERETRREGHVVHVRPELVVEIAFDGVQTSSRYPGGMALRFARVKGYRPDKPASRPTHRPRARGPRAAPCRREPQGRERIEGRMTIRRLTASARPCDTEYRSDNPMRRQLAEHAQLAGVTLRPVVACARCTSLPGRSSSPAAPDGYVTPC